MKKILLILTLFYSQFIFALSEREGHSLISGTEIVKLFASLASVIVLVLIFSYLFKKMNGLSLGREDMMKIHASLCVGPKEKIILIEVGGEALLVGVTAGGISLLKTVGSDLLKEACVENSFPNTFKQFFNKAT